MRLIFMIALIGARRGEFSESGFTGFAGFSGFGGVRLGLALGPSIGYNQPMTSTLNDAAESVAASLREGMRHIAGRGQLVNEASTLSLLIQPTLNALGYPATYRIPEYGEQRNRLDEACFLNVVNSSPGHAAVIVEAKEYGTDFDKSVGRYGSPDRQIQRYLKQHAASGPSTLGVLTDGAKWRIYRRVGNAANPDVEFLVEHNFRSLAQPDQTSFADFDDGLLQRLQDLVDRLGRANIAFRTIPSRASTQVNPADGLFAAIAESLGPDYILRQLLDEPDAMAQTNLAEAVVLQGVRRDVHDNDWETYAYSPAIPLQSDNPTLTGNRAVIAAVQYRHDPDRGLSRPDAALCARTFASASDAGAAVVLAYSAAPDDSIEARLAVAAGGQVNMTAAFDPTLPAPSARTAIGQLLPLLHDPGKGLAADKLLSPLEAAPLRQQFYREVAQWTGRMQKGKNRQQRQAILRHLVRVMFAWILKEESVIPPELFERAFVNAHLDDAGRYHSDVLRFLFHQRLNVPHPVRSAHDVDAVQDAMEQTPFLNGSLFAEHSDDDELDIAPSDYWSADESEPGLFTILSRYHWTMDEHRPGESEQTLDPELLSNLFERLITPTEEGTEPPLRQPQGTYYTPADVADEMVKDALAAAVRDPAPTSISDAELLALFGSTDAPLPAMTPTQRVRLTRRIKELRIFDPAVGSGEFLFSTLLALQRALGKLEPDAANPAADIIKSQLAGQDIHPLAVQIARLRLFIAITAARRDTPTDEPLPNLEARIVCADTLETVANPDWRPGQPGQLDTADPELIAALTAVGENRANWFSAHTEEDKQEVLKQDKDLRANLQTLLQQKGELASPELMRFAESPLYNINPTPARTDARLLFYENPWRGFDIVIGNPPYTNLDRAIRKTLADEKRYQTTNVNDTYSLFCETGLALANPDGGVVTMVVPFSIAFGQRQKSLRDVFANRCQEVILRHYDNRPDTTFNASPTVQSPENRQRATIFTAILGENSPFIAKSSGLQRWSADERSMCLLARTTTSNPSFGQGVDNRLSGQWPRIPTFAVADMVQTIMDQTCSVGEYATAAGEAIALPQTAYQFISSIPRGSISPRSENLFTVASHDTVRLVMTVLNGHIAYGWWWVFGDAFHLKPFDLTSLKIPDTWVQNPQPAIDLGQRLIDAIPECIVENRQQGGVWRNVNFHLKPDLIAELDRLHIAALGLEEEPLLTHLRIMRSSSSWNYPSA